ncbi:MAG TPA: DUF1329 domain-containing protein [Burkholderiaceae bacterium]|nr:DUF1329 domain-containing protein [Burkholderiaceae bacterium]
MTTIATAVLVVATLAQGAFAAVSADEAKQLGGKLTLVGAEAAGNKEGTIPAYSGKAPKAPASYNKAEPGQRPDPYGDKPLFTITAANAAQYADKLDGLVEVFKKYPNFRMDIYPSHRDFAYPKYVLDNTVKNATSCKGANDELKLEGCYGGFPFPIPKTGKQVMWNHLMQFTGSTLDSRSDSWVTPPNGQGVLQARSRVQQQYDFFDPKQTQPHPSNLTYWSLLVTDDAPARKAGGKIAILDSLDMVDVGRRAYQYIPGQRRVKLAPNLAYDTPSPQSGGASTMDDGKGYLGAMDRFDFKLVGKKEKFIMYNTFNFTNHKVCPLEKTINHPNFPNPDCTRWELHRVWKVEATLKSDFRHVYAKRVFFWDEDVPGAGMAENYDASGKPYRFITQVMNPFYDGEKGGGGGYTDSSISLDMQTGLWAFQSYQGFPGGGVWPDDRQDPRIFTPDALAGTGIR